MSELKAAAWKHQNGSLITAALKIKKEAQSSIQAAMVMAYNTPLYEIPNTHRVLSKEGLDLLLSFVPDETPTQVEPGLDPTFYYTNCYEGDLILMEKLAAIRATINKEPTS